MAQKIYKLCLIRGYTEAYYQLTEAEKKQLWERVGSAIDKAGAKMATPYGKLRPAKRERSEDQHNFSDSSTQAQP